MKRPTIWTRERCEKLRSLYPHTLNREIAEILGVTESAVNGQAFKMRLFKDRTFMLSHSLKGQFKKGHIPSNKGKKQTEYMSPESIERTKETRFKKGQDPPNAWEDWQEKPDRDGYLYIKLPGRKKKTLKHRWIWEQKFGPIPKGYNIQFKDGNRQNCDIDNLYIISRAEQMKSQNSLHRYPKEIARLIQIKGAISRQINKATKNGNDRRNSGKNERPTNDL